MWFGEEADARRADLVELEATRLERRGEALLQMAAVTDAKTSERYAAAAAAAFELAEEALARADQLRAPGAASYEYALAAR